MTFTEEDEQVAWMLTKSLAKILEVEPWALAEAIVSYVRSEHGI